jgi:hypothetical protein
MKALREKAAVMEKKLVEDNKKIMASSTLKADLQNRAAEMEKLLIESNKQNNK